MVRSPCIVMKSDAQAAKPRRLQIAITNPQTRTIEPNPMRRKNGGADCASRPGTQNCGLEPGKRELVQRRITLSADRSAGGPGALPAAGREAGCHRPARPEA